MDEKYGISLELDTKQFKSKINETATLAKKVTSRIKSDFSGIKNSIDFRINLKGQNVEKLKATVKQLKTVLESDLKMPVELRMSEEERGQLKSDLEYAEKQLKKIEQQLNKTSSSISNIGNSSKGTGNNIENSFSKGLKSIRKFTLGMFGVRSAFSFFKSQMSAYKNENKIFSSGMQLTSDIITQSLAPAFEFFGNVLQYTMIGLARIIELMFNVNILSKVTSNGLKRASDSAKELNDNLTGLDEITNLNGDNSSTLSGITAQLDALDEFHKKIKDVDKWLKETGLDKFFPTLGKGIKDVWNWVKEHPFETLLGIGTFMTLKGLLPGILGVSGGTTGLFGLSGILSTLMKIGVITIGIKIIYDNINKINDAVDDLEKYTSKVTNQYTSQFDKWLQLAQDSYQKYLETGNETYKKISDDAYQSAIDLANDQVDYLENNSGRLSWWNFIFNHDDYVAAEKELELVKEQAKNAQKDLENINGIKSTATIDLDMDTSKAKNKINNLWDVIKYAGNNIWDSISGTWKALTGQYDPYEKANGGIFVGNAWKDITEYAGGGSPSVGEMFIAREAGPEFVGTIGNHTAVMNNNQIVSSVSDGVAIAVAKVMGATQQHSSSNNAVFNIDGREFARAIYPYLQEEAQRMGSSLNIRRV